METTKKLEVVVTERQTENGKKFLTYKTYSKNGRATDLKFTKEVENAPKKNCFIVVACNNMNLDTKTKFPCLWVKKIESIESAEEGRAEANAKKLTDYFG